MKIRNIDGVPYSDKHGMYGGTSGRKEGLIIDGHDWIVKYPKNVSHRSGHAEMAYTNDPVSEYLGSHIYEILGYPVHETMLVERNGKIAVACRDFIDNGARERLLEIRTIKNTANRDLAEMLERSFSSTGSDHVVNFEEILLHMSHNDILKNVSGLKERFFDMLVVDAFINNSDRDNGNWGIIRQPGMPDCLAPVFDNGGSFNGKTPDSKLELMLDIENGVRDSVMSSVTVFGADSRFLVRDILRMNIPELRQAIKKNVPRIRGHMDDIHHLIDDLPDKACSPVRKTFYKVSSDMRLDMLLTPEYERISNDR